MHRSILKATVILMFLLICGVSNSSLNNTSWVIVWESSEPYSQVSASGLHVSDAGDIYVSGHYTGQNPPANLIEYFNNDVSDGRGETLWLANLGPDGSTRWVESWGHPCPIEYTSNNRPLDLDLFRFIHCKSLVVDRNNVIYVLGEMSGRSVFHTGPEPEIIDSNSRIDDLLGTFDSSGNLNRVFTSPWPDHNMILDPFYHRSHLDNGIILGPENDLILITESTFNGENENPSDTNCTTMCNSQGNTVAIFKVDICNGFTFVRYIEGNIGSGKQMVLDNEGSLYIAGSFTGNIDFNPDGIQDIHKSYGETDIFLTKLDSDFNYLWTETWGTTEREEIKSICINSRNEVIIAGHTNHSTTYKPGIYFQVPITLSNQNIFVSKISSSGELIWTREWGGEYRDCISHVAVNSSNGRIYTLGTYGRTADFNPDPLVTEKRTAIDLNDMFLSELTDDGQFSQVWVWENQMNPSDYVYQPYAKGTDIFVDNRGQIYITGEFLGEFEFIPGSEEIYSSPRTTSAFLIKFALEVP